MPQIGRVKSVLSGDTVVMTSVNDPSKERIISLAYVSSPRLRKEGDEPFAFESRDFLRNALVGKVVSFSVLYEIPNTKREYGQILTKEGLTFPDESIKQGWLKLRDDAGRKDDSETTTQKLDELRLFEAQAKSDDKGLWAPGGGQIETQYDLGDPDAFLKEWKGKSINSIVERVLSGDRLLIRLMLSPTHHIQTLCLLGGIRAPATERTNPSDQRVQPAEPYANEARSFVEERLLQRSVKADVLGLSPQNQLILTVRHPAGNISEFLLKNGLARCTDFHSTMLGNGMATLRKAEKEAQTAKKGLHESYVAKEGGASVDATVTRVFSADVIYVRNKAGAEKRISFSSIRGPRQNDPAESPYKEEAKEYLRKKLIGKHVRVVIDGQKPATDDYEAKEVATVTYNDKNIGLQLVQDGWASVIRHRRDDTDRAANYDELLAAQETAKEAKKGMWSGKTPATKTYVDASESVQRAKIQLSTLQRQKKVPAIVDFVKGPSRFSILIPREGIKLNFVLGGIRAPKSARSPTDKGEPYGQEGHDLAVRRCSQRDVEINVHNIDKVGGFIGELFVNRESFAKILVEEGLAEVHQYSAEQIGNANELLAAEKKAKEARKNLWTNWDPSQDEEEATETHDANGDSAPVERKTDYRDVVVTNVDDAGKLKVQLIGTGTAALETLMSAFKTFHLNPANSAGLPSPPKAGDFVAAQFTEDKQWYRARIRSNDRAAKEAEVVYIDYGNSEKLPWSKLRPLSQPQFIVQKLKAQAVDAVLSLVQLPTSADYLKDAVGYITQLTAGAELAANVDYTSPEGTLHLTLYDPSNSKSANDSLNSEIVSEGLGMVPKKLRPWERAMTDVYKVLKDKEAVAKDEHRGMWEYGDPTED